MAPLGGGRFRVVPYFNFLRVPFINLVKRLNNGLLTPPTFLLG